MTKKKLSTLPPTSEKPKRNHLSQTHALKIVGRSFYKIHRRKLLLGALLACATIAMGCALLGLSGWFITATAIAGLSAGTAIMFDVFTPSASIRLLSLGRSASRYAERLVTHDATLSVLVELRSQLFTGWAQAGVAKELALRPSRMLFRLTQDLDALENLYLRIGVPIFSAFVTALLIGIFLGFIQPWLGLICFLWLCATGFSIAWQIWRTSVVPSARYAQTLEQLRAQTVDLVAGQTDLLMAGELETQKHKLQSLDNRLHLNDLKMNQIELKGAWLLTVTQSMGIAAMLLTGAWLFENNLITVPVATLLVLLAVAAIEPFAGLRRGALDAGKTWLAARRLAPAIEHSNQPLQGMLQPPLDVSFSVSIDALNYSYHSAATKQSALVPLPNALSHISLDIPKGQHVAIVGPSGCGKSTLLALIGGELPAQDANVFAHPAALLTQRTELFQDTVRGNLDLRQEHLNDTTLWQALENAGLAEDIRQTPKGLDTWLGEGGLGLSGGQSRRLALARLFLAPHDIWLLDEPTESLDQTTAKDVMQRIKAHAANKTLIIATHLEREAAIANRIIVMQEGKITASAEAASFDFYQICQKLRKG